MDIKAMAKSKRSHTCHHEPRKPKPPSSSSSSTAATQSSSEPKPSKREVRERKGSTQPPSLPSNWSRYEDDDPDEEGQVRELPFDSNSDGPSRLTASKSKAAPDVAKPKSKGADFSYLIAQAKESQSHYVSPPFDDTLPDFYQGLGPMLAVRGENILSWDGGDNFLGEDEGTTHEVPLLNLDLQALAEQLAKVDLAKRLFIEEDILPPELRASEANEANVPLEPFQKPEKQITAAGSETFHELLSLYLEAEQEAERQNKAKAGDASSSAFVSSFNPEPASVADVTDHKLDNLSFLDGKEVPMVTHIPKQDLPPSSRFEATAAEAELNMLLNSFGETKFFDSSAPQSEVASSMKQHSDPVSSSKDNSVTVVTSSQHSLGPSTAAFPSSLDDALDDLLEETSKANYKDGLFQSAQVQGTSVNPPSSSPSSIDTKSKSKQLEDFDTWFDNL